MEETRIKIWRLVIICVLLVAAFSIYGIVKSSRIVQTDNENYLNPEAERLDILILGIRGEDDPEADLGGALLTDTIQIVSYDKKTKKSSSISLPRDLYVQITENKKDKLNIAYEYGLAHSADPLKFTKSFYSDLTGVYIDKAVVFDFKSFEKVVDAIGGVDIVLAKSFEEKQQWGYTFYLPAGPNHLNGQEALYYVRSRYSTNDFDRARRQQEVMLAIKQKLSEINFFSDPIKTLNILNAVKNNIQTDIGIWDINEFLGIAKNLNTGEMKKHVVSTDNYVVESKINGLYVLLPKNGSLDEIQKLFKESLAEPQANPQ